MVARLVIPFFGRVIRIDIRIVHARDLHIGNVNVGAKFEHIKVGLIRIDTLCFPDPVIETFAAVEDIRVSALATAEAIIAGAPF